MKTIVIIGAAATLLMPLRIAAQAQMETIYKFAGTPDGAAPQGLAAGPNGVLYGMTADGGSLGYGTVFQLTPPSTGSGPWTESILYEFTSSGGGTNPFSAPVLGKDGSIYGATGDVSTIFQLQPPAAPDGAWTETVLYPPDEGDPVMEFDHGLIVGPNEELYAAGFSGGDDSCGGVVGLTPPSVSGKWSVSMEYTFPGGNSGCKPTGIAISADGVIYGVTLYGGTYGQGIVFALTPSSVPYQYTETVLYNFTGGTDGGLPSEPPILVPIQNPDAALAIYGTTSAGGTAGFGGVFELLPNIYTNTWTESIAFSFVSGKLPSSALLNYNGDFYGTMAAGTSPGDAGGSIFQLYPNYYGILNETALHNFKGPAGPSGNLVMDKNGVLYGTTVAGPGPTGLGTVYRVKP